jgi:hypothetical protein
MTVVRISPTSIVAEGHTDREVCIAISAMLQTAGAILDKMGVACAVHLNPAAGTYDLRMEPISYVRGRSVKEDIGIWCGVSDAIKEQLTELAADHPGRLILEVTRLPV